MLFENIIKDVDNLLIKWLIIPTTNILKNNIPLNIKISSSTYLFPLILSIGQWLFPFFAFLGGSDFACGLE